MTKSYIKLFVSLLVGGGLFYYTLQYFEIDKTIYFIKSARTDYLVAALSLLIVSYLMRGARWMIWEEDLKYWDSFKLVLVGFMGNNVLPARLGEILRAHCAAEKIDNYYGRTATLASIMLERILDGFALAIIGFAGLIMVPVNHFLQKALLFVCMLFFVLTAGLLTSISLHGNIRNLMAKLNAVFPGQLSGFSKEKVEYFLDGLLLIRGFGRLGKALLVTSIIWGVELAMYYLIANAVSRGVSVETCLIFLAVVNFASLFPFTVGGIGAIEGATTIYLVSAAIPANEALAMVLIQHGYQFFFVTSLGALFYFTSRYYDISLIRTNKVDKPETNGAPDVSLNAMRERHNRLNEVSTALGIEKAGTKEIELSVVIPAFNEEDRLPKTVMETINWCRRNVASYELIITDDGSSDETLEIARLFSKYDGNIKVLACPHLGKGSAVRIGILNALGSHVLFMDADGATPLDEIPKLMAQIDAGYAVAIGSRIIRNAGETVVKTSLHRKLIGRTFAAFVNIFAIKGIADTQCGFKMFRKDITKELFSRQKINGFAFDVELLYLASKLSLPMAEVPVNWINQKGSKVNLVTDSIKMLKDIFKIRFLHRKGISSKRQIYAKGNN
jgi:dolichyl-phosphate beta-glucosyltransferase